jgi:hypothetical protein
MATSTVNPSIHLFIHSFIHSTSGYEAVSHVLLHAQIKVIQGNVSKANERIFSSITFLFYIEHNMHIDSRPGKRVSVEQ